MLDTQIIDGKQIARECREKIAALIQSRGLHPKLAVIQIGNHPASNIYVENKKKAAGSVGIEVEIYRLDALVTEQSVLELIDELNAKKSINGILLQLPLPPHLNELRLTGRISPQKDVDGLHPQNVGNLVVGLPAMVPCTPMGCLYLLKKTLKNLDGKNALMIGRSSLVGRPLAHLLQAQNCTVTLAHSHTQNLSDLCRRADILVCAVGKPGLIKGPDIKEGATIIDVGINRLDDGKIVGDVLFLEAMGKAAYITPVPGGVGPMTIAMLLWNVVRATDENILNGKEVIPFV